MFHSIQEHNTVDHKAAGKMHHMHMSKEGDGWKMEHHTEGHKVVGHHSFPKASGPKVKLPAGHPLAHIAKHMGMEHEIVPGGEAEAVPEEVGGTEAAGAAY